MEIADNSFKTVINMFRNLMKSINKMRKEMEDRKNKQLQEMKNTVTEMKT